MANSTSGIESPDKAAFKALFNLNKSNPSILLTNGFLELIRSNEEFGLSLSKDEVAFIEASVDRYEQDIELAVAAAEEGNTALIEAEAKAQELAIAKDAAEAAQHEANEARQESDRKREDIEAELESTAQYNLESSRQEFQFSFADRIKWPIFVLMGSVVLAAFILSYQEKESAQTWATVVVSMVSGVVGVLGTIAAAIYALSRKEENRPDKQKKQEPSQPEA